MFAAGYACFGGTPARRNSVVCLLTSALRLPDPVVPSSVSICGFFNPNRAVAPKPTDEANRYNLGHLTPKTFQKALYVGLSQIGQPLQVVYFGWSGFPFPEAPLAGQSEPQSTPFSAEALS